MADRLKIPEDSVRYHPNGITLDGFSPLTDVPEKPTLGYLARLCPLKGLDLLVDAYIELKQSDKYEHLRLAIAGGMTDEDEPFVEEQRRKLTQAGVIDQVSITPNVDRDRKLEFLRELSVFCVPARYPEAFGLYVIEAMAAGVPVVLPEAGAFPEIVESTQGGKLYDSSDSMGLVHSLDNLLDDPEHAKVIGMNGHQAVTEQYANEKLALSLVDHILSPIHFS